VAERPVTFVDTSVLAYAHDRSEPRRQPVARARLEALWHSRTGALSTQVLQELYVATRKLAAPMGRATAVRVHLRMSFGVRLDV
jgi:predicted nucleic acid-binding protein